jgi:[ribosomal protein S5]-alanine N-acetyltransferase
MSPPITTLESERLYLYPMGLSFCTEIYLSWLNDSDVYKYLESGGGYTMEALVDYVQKSVENKVFFWAICLKENGKHIGNIKIDPISYRHKRGEYGILIGDKSEWNKGFAKEASEVVINFCFDILGLRKITLGVVSSNIAAVSMYKKMGFINEGIYLNHGEYDNKVVDVFRMALFNKKFMNE